MFEYEYKNDFGLNDLVDFALEAPAGKEILAEALYVTKMLIQKNISYGNSALYPASIFSKGTAVEQLSARLDDKLNRIKNNQTFENEGMVDAVDDILGYLILLKIAIKNQLKEDK